MTRRRVIAAAVLLALGALVIAFCGEDDPREPEARVPADLAPPYDGFGGPLPSPTADADAEATAMAEDAGGLLAAWAAALQPVLKRDGGVSTTAVFVRSADGGATANPFEVLLRRAAPSTDGGRRPRPGAPVAAEEPDVPEPPDAGLACDPGPIRIALRQNRLDLVVAIDTSGSMFSTLPSVNEWLTRKLEPDLKKSGLDYQLMVLVDLEDLRKTVQIVERRRSGRTEIWAPSDAGINLGAEVQSNDALDVLLESASQVGGSWLTRLRPDAQVHLLVVTDDRPRPSTMASFVPRLTELAGGRLGTAAEPRFTFHGLLGLETSAEAWVIAPDRPLVGTRAPRCGVHPGNDYQALAQQTKGLRGSVCHAESMNAFVDQLIGPLRASVRCDSTLPPNFPADRPITMRALAADGRSQTLGKAFDHFNCEASTAGYFVQNHQVRVCPKSCAALTSEGYDVIEAIGVCR